MSEHPTMKSTGSILAKMAQTQGLRTITCPKHGEIRSHDDHTCYLCEDENAQVRAQAEAKAARLKAIVYHAGIPPRFRAKTFDGFEAGSEAQARVLRICRAYADRFDERHAAGGGVVMCGNPGTGKTHLA